mgnify:CR=1 FL=1
MSMDLFQDLLIVESQKQANKEARQAVHSINDAYNEWKKIKRRRNAVNIVTTCVNKIATIDPATIDRIHEPAKLKLATVIMRCLDIPPWKSLEAKRKIYQRLFPLIDKLQSIDPNTGTGGCLRDVLMTRFSACLTGCCETERGKKVFVAYEPKVSNSYLRFIFGQDKPEKTYRMQALPLPKDFDELLKILKINHEKGIKKYYGSDPINVL